jgi:carboxylesterase type B
MPVIVFLHGGAFVVGSCEAMLYGPQVLLDREVRAYDSAFGAVTLGYSDFNNLMGFTSNKLPNNILKNVW